MAKSKEKEKVGNEAGLEPASAPSFRESAAASSAAETARIEALVEKAGGTVAEPKEAPAPTKTPEQEYQEWYDGLPEERRAQFAKNVIENHSRQLDEYYGPEVGAILEAVSKKPELKKKLARLTDEQFQTWVFDTAATIYDDPRFAGTAAADGEVPKDPRYDALEKQIGEIRQRDEERERKAYMDARVAEREALVAKYPDLRFSDPKSKEAKRLLAVIERGEELSQKEKRIVPYAEVYEQYREMWDFQAGNPPPKAAPATSPATIPTPQAPRTKFEARAGISATLDKHGGITALASALRK